jgi:hypothetical protein
LLIIFLIVYLLLSFFFLLSIINVFITLFIKLLLMTGVTNFLGRIAIVIIFISLQIIVPFVAVSISISIIVGHLLVLLLFTEGKLMVEVEIVQDGLLIDKETRRTDALVFARKLALFFLVNAAAVITH